MRQTTTRRGALATVAVLAASPTAVATAAPAASVLAAPVAQDPVFALIETHRAALTAKKAVPDLYWRGRLTPEYGRAQDQERAALRALLETMPTTQAGVIAALVYMGTVVHEMEEAPLRWSRVGGTTVTVLDMARDYRQSTDSGKPRVWKRIDAQSAELRASSATYLRRLGEALASITATA